MLIFLKYVGSIEHEDGKRIVGWTASTAQIAGNVLNISKTDKFYL
jgi:hypothetical protein